MLLLKAIAMLFEGFESNKVIIWFKHTHTKKKKTGARQQKFGTIPLESICRRQANTFALQDDKVHAQNESTF